jgi:hypothetical protein
MTLDLYRLSILTAQEVDDLYGLPRFTDQDRQLYFDLSVPEHAAVTAVHTASVCVHLILQLGYFKAKRQFFIYEQEAVLEDLHYVLEKYFPEKALASIKTPSKPTRLEHQKLILKLFDYRICDNDAKVELERRAQRTAMLSTQPRVVVASLSCTEK